jgi:hypothetical protein
MVGVMSAAEAPSDTSFPRRELEICWAAISTLNAAEQTVLLRELATKVAAYKTPFSRNPPDRFRQAIASLFDAPELLGRPPKVGEYRALRTAFPELNLMSDRAICRALGTPVWADCLREAYLPVGPSVEIVRGASQDNFSLQDVQDAVHDYVNEHDSRVPTLGEYLGWAQLPYVQARARYPRSAHSFAKFGGYREVLDSMGLRTQRRDTQGRLVSLSFAYTDSQLLDAVRGVARALGHSPRFVEYAEYRDRAIANVEEAGADVPPSPSTLTERFGPWPDVLAAAGLAPIDPSRRSRKKVQRRPTYTDADLLAHARNAWVAKGEPFTCEAFSSWRREQMAAAYEAGQNLAIPMSTTVAARFDGWANVRRLVRSDQ